MRITKSILKKQNEILKAVVFVLLSIVFILSVTISIQIPEMKKILNKSVSNTEQIINILTIGE